MTDRQALTLSLALTALCAAAAGTVLCESAPERRGAGRGGPCSSPRAATRGPVLARPAPGAAVRAPELGPEAAGSATGGPQVGAEVEAPAPLEETAADSELAEVDEAAERAERAAALLASLAAEEDPLAAAILGEELALLAQDLDAAGQARLLELAREGDAPRLAALRALGRLTPGAEAVEQLRRAALLRTSPEVRAAAVDALLLLRARGAPGAAVLDAVLELTHPAFGPLDRELALAREESLR